MIHQGDTTPLLALTHLDGRNAHKLLTLRSHFSEFSWMKLRLCIIVEYCRAIYQTLERRKLDPREKQKLTAVYEHFSLTHARAVVKLEKTVNHDIKALELFAGRRLRSSGLAKYIPYINLGIGSEDINSIALGLQLKNSRGEVLTPALSQIAKTLQMQAQKEKDTVMVARTHGGAANVTTFGKEIANHLSRLCDEFEIFMSLSFSAKCSGEAGTFQAFTGVDRRVDWIAFSDTFIRSFGLVPTAATQIAPYDSIIRYFQSVYRINSILLDLVKNMWLYVLLGYLRVKKVDAEVGSAGMPHKVNPIYFEGAEGGLEMANGIIEIFVRKLPVNRLSRDFSDSTVRRNFVLPLAYSLLSYQSLTEAFDRIVVDREGISKDLQTHREIFIETVKTYGLSHEISDMYDRLKEVSRGKELSEQEFTSIIASLPLKESEKQALIALCDGNHNPYPVTIVEEVVKRSRNVFHIKSAV